MTPAEKKYLEFTNFNWPEVIKAADKANIRLVTYCTIDLNDHDPKNKGRISMSPAFFIAMAYLKPQLAYLPFGSLEKILVGSAPTITTRLVAKHKELMWEGWVTAPDLIKKATTFFERSQKIKEKRWNSRHKKYTIAQPVEDCTINGLEYLKTAEGEIKFFNDVQHAKNFLVLSGMTLAEVKESLDNQSIQIEPYQ
jgi:hypothetical protein